jgi:pimeloyl-ACP methyl ester carboxylesterase
VNTIALATCYQLTKTVSTQTKNGFANLPQLSWVTIKLDKRRTRIPCLFRKGTTGPTLFFMHGLGGAKENFYAAYQSPALSNCTLVSFDFPGTGQGVFDPSTTPDLTSLARVGHLVWQRVLGNRPAFLVAASMGGLIALLMLRNYGYANVRGLINIEGNLAPEDCMFSRRVVSHTYDELSGWLFERIRADLQESRYAGDQMIAHNMALNTNPLAYFAYSFETVRESDSGRLLPEFLALPIPKLFLYGEANRSLSYLDRLRQSDVTVREISRSAHFLFYDNPVQTYQEIASFIAKAEAKR